MIIEHTGFGIWVAEWDGVLGIGDDAASATVDLMFNSTVETGIKIATSFFLRNYDVHR